MGENLRVGGGLFFLFLHTTFFVLLQFTAFVSGKRCNDDDAMVGNAVAYFGCFKRIDYWEQIGSVR